MKLNEIYNNQAAFGRAQSAYDNMSEPDEVEYPDVPCAECEGTGQVTSNQQEDPNGDEMMPCPECEGRGERQPNDEEIRDMEADAQFNRHNPDY